MRTESNMKRWKVIVLTVAMAVMVTGLAWTQEDVHGRSVEEILQQIMRNQGVERVGAINPNELDMELLEELGDGVMGLMVADEQQHEWMDRMMGGEGSTELASMHAWLGYNYLQNDGNLAGFGPGMMGFGMMGPGMMGGRNWAPDSRGSWSSFRGTPSGWHGASPFGWWSGPFLWIIGLLLLVLLVALVVALVRTRRLRGGSRSLAGAPESALAILQARYARGELSQEEYREMKKELR